MTELIGKQLNSYRIDALIGEGGMGAVYKATHLNLNRPVALKVMHPHFARQGQFQQRFLQEAQTVAQLEHESIIRVTDFGQADGLYYMVMAHVPGANLTRYITEMVTTDSVVPLNETLLIMAQVAEALAYAHHHQVIHRDIKPDNILIRHLDAAPPSDELPLRAIVTDFGLAKLIGSGIQTQTGSFMGTLPYMSPEQFTGETLDGRSDIYSLGIMLFQLTTGHLPFNIKSPTDAALKHMQDPIPLPNKINPNLPKSAETIILKATAKRPQDRYQSATTIALELRQIAAALTNAECIQFAPDSGRVSLTTVLKPPKASPPLTHHDPNRLATRGEDQLIIATKGEAPKSVSLTQATMFIGRIRESHIHLNSSGVSRKHAHLERTTTGWRISDCGSSNGTYLDDHKLIPNVPEAWQPGKLVRIGSYFLKWQPAGSPDLLAIMNAGVRTAVPTGAAQILSYVLNLDVIVNPTTSDITAGDRTDVQVELVNIGNIVDQFILSIDGLPAEWITMPQSSTDLMPGTQSTITYTIHPPKSTAAIAGDYPYKLLVQSQANPTKTATVSCQLTLSPYNEFSLEMAPSQIKNGESSQITLYNSGNTDTIIRLIGKDPAEALLFNNEGQRIRLAPGQQETIPVKIAIQKRPFIGTHQTIPFELVAGTNHGQHKTVTGQLDVKPVVPRWVVAMMGILLILACGSSIWGYNTYTGWQDATRVAETAVVSTIIAQAGTTANGSGNAPITSTLTPPPPPFAQDCVAFNPATAYLQESGGNWSIVSENIAMLHFADKQADAEIALQIIQHYGMNEQCFVGRPDASFTYFLVDKRPPVGAIATENCVNFDPNNLQISGNSPATIRDGSETIMPFEIESEANQSRNIIIYYQFSQMCTIGQSDAPVHYFRQ